MMLMKRKWVIERRGQDFANRYRRRDEGAMEGGVAGGKQLWRSGICVGDGSGQGGGGRGGRQSPVKRVRHPGGSLGGERGPVFEGQRLFTADSARCDRQAMCPPHPARSGW